MGATYSGRFFCTNCAWSGESSVDKGTTLADAADDAQCPNCGCKTVHPSS